jgi:hypothetical protein
MAAASLQGIQCALPNLRAVAGVEFYLGVTVRKVMARTRITSARSDCV